MMVLTGNQELHGVCTENRVMIYFFV